MLLLLLLISWWKPFSIFPAWTVIVRQSITSATVTGSCVVSPPCSWESLLGEGPFSLNDLSPLLSHWNGHQNCNSPCVDPSIFTLVFLLCCCLLCDLLECECDLCESHLEDLYYGCEHEELLWSVVGLLWCVTAQSMGVTPVFGTWASWATHGVVAIIPVSWPEAASIWVVMTWAVVSAKMWLWPGMTSPVHVFTVMSGAWPGMVAFVQFGLVVFCWGSQTRTYVDNPLQCDHTHPICNT